MLLLEKFSLSLPRKKDKLNQLVRLCNVLKKEYNITPVFGAEIEFYLYQIRNDQSLVSLSNRLDTILKKEKGQGQFEVEVPPTENVLTFINDIISIREKITQAAITEDMLADFSPKPKLDDYGSALHIHLNFKEDDNVEKYANILCNYARDTIQFFLQNEESRQRLDSNYMAPTHICWGGNNRTCMIRIPDSMPKRIEHRLASADINPLLPVYAILSSIAHGLKGHTQLKLYPKIYGNAFEEQYNLEPINQ